ncbi:MAG: hypothetical protein KDJ19_12975 [Hyphomicrobiaceae bacterium]|nr:hypothetical protein [Hyphomicrobiaceae bacterium]
MDVEGLLQNVIRFSNYMTARLLVAGVFFYVMAGFVHLGDPAEGILPNLDLLKSIIENYQSIFDILGVSDFALVLIVFLFITAIHITYIGFDRIGYYIPPAIVPLPGWDAIEDLTQSAFDILREARGEEHTDAENQRLFEFRRKLENIDERNEDKHREELQSTNAAFRISKSMMVFALIAWLVALIGRDYQGDASLLLVIFLFAAAIFIITMIAINRAHYERIDDLRTEVIQQLLGFTSIWAPAEYQARMAAACVPSRNLKPTSFKVLMPVYGTFDAFARDMKRLGDAALTPANTNIPAPAAPLMQSAPTLAVTPEHSSQTPKPKNSNKKSRKKQRN